MSASIGPTLSLRMSASPARAGTAPDFARVLEEQLTALPGVVAASASWMNVFGRGNMQASLGLPGVQPPVEEAPVRINVVTPGHIRTLGVTLLRGRDLEWSDTAESEHVALVNAAFVEHYFAGIDPLGQSLQLDEDDSRTVVGVVSDFLWNDLRASREPFFVLPAAQMSRIAPGAVQVRMTGPVAGNRATPASSH